MISLLNSRSPIVFTCNGPPRIRTTVGSPAHVVQRLLGHSKIEMTLGIYAHALPSMQQDAASKLAALLHG